MVLNAHHDLVDFTLPPCAGGSAWPMLIDTTIPEDAREQSFEIGEPTTSPAARWCCSS